MGKWIRRLLLAGAVGGLLTALLRRRRGGFDPTHPSHDWGTTSLRIDGSDGATP